MNIHDKDPNNTDFNPVKENQITLKNFLGKVANLPFAALQKIADTFVNLGNIFSSTHDEHHEIKQSTTEKETSTEKKIEDRSVTVQIKGELMTLDTEKLLHIGGTVQPSPLKELYNRMEKGEKVTQDDLDQMEKDLKEMKKLDLNEYKHETVSVNLKFDENDESLDKLRNDANFQSLLEKTGGELHLYKGKLSSFVDLWEEQENDKVDKGDNNKQSFEDFLLHQMQANLDTDKDLINGFSGNHVRYFSDTERKQTETTIENGVLKQIGLNSDSTDKKPLEKLTKYAFILRPEGLFITEKKDTDNGQVNHSSFFRGGEVQSSGGLFVDDEGKITTLYPLSGHYKPNADQLEKMITYLEKKLPKEDFDEILMKVNPNDTNEEGLTLDEVKEHIKIEKEFIANQSTFIKDNGGMSRGGLIAYNEKLAELQKYRLLS